MSGGRTLTTEFLIAVAVITADEIAVKGRVPLPSRYLWGGVAFAILGFAAPFITDKLAATMGAGIVLALGYQVLAPKLGPNKAGETPQPSQSNGGSVPQRVE